MSDFTNEQKKQLYHILKDSPSDVEASNQAAEFGTQAIPELVRLLGSKYGPMSAFLKVNDRAELTLLKLPGDAVVDEILKELGNKPGFHARTMKAIYVMMQIEDPRVDPWLTGLLESSSEQIASYAAKALVYRKSPDAAELFTDRILNYHRNRRFNWYYAFALIGFAAFSVALVLGSVFSLNKNTPDNMLMSDIIFGLGCTGILIFFICVLLAQNQMMKPTFHKEAVTGLGELDKVDAIGALALSARDWRLRKNALESLLPLLEKIDENYLMALPPEQMRAVLKLLSINDERFQLALIRALPFIGDEIALPALKRLANGSRAPHNLREEAASSVQKLTLILARRSEQNQLLRAIDKNDDTNILLRPADGVKTASEEQLLRPAAQNEEI